MADGRHADAQGVCFGLRADKAIDDFGDDALYLRRVVDAQSAFRTAEQGDGLAVPRFVSGFAKDPIDDRSLWLVGRRDPKRIGRNVVLAPHLTVVVR